MLLRDYHSKVEIGIFLLLQSEQKQGKQILAPRIQLQITVKHTTPHKQQQTALTKAEKGIRWILI